MERKVYTLSFHQGANLAHRGHNIRSAAAIRYQDHIDPSLIGQNVTFKDQTIREAYDEIFEDAFTIYRNASARPDRIRKTYYDTVANDSRLNLCYEAIVQIGDHNTIGYRTVFTAEENRAYESLKRGKGALISDEMKEAVRKVLDAQKAVKACERFVQTWPERNPGMHLFGAYLHADESEGTIHLHLDYIPVVDKQKRGAPVQTSLDRCCKKIVEERYTKEELAERTPRKRGGQKTAENLWQNLQREDLQKIAHEIGLELDWTKESPTPSKHLETPEFKQMKDLIKEKESLIKEQEASIRRYADQAEKAKLEAADLYDQIRELKGMLATGNASLRRVKEQMIELSQDYDQAQKKVSQALHQVEEKTKELERLEAEQISLEERNAFLFQENEELKSEIYHCDCEKQNLEKKVSDLELQLDQAGDKADQLKEKEKSLEKRIEDYQVQLGQVIDTEQDMESFLEQNREKGLLGRSTGYVRMSEEMAKELYKKAHVRLSFQQAAEEKMKEAESLMKSAEEKMDEAYIYEVQAKERLDLAQALVDDRTEYIRAQAEVLMDREYRSVGRNIVADAERQRREAEKARKEAEADRAKAAEERSRYEQLRKDMERLISEKAKEMYDQMAAGLDKMKARYEELVSECEARLGRIAEHVAQKARDIVAGLRRGPEDDSREAEMERFMSKYDLGGQTMLERFEAEEVQREMEARSWDDWGPSL